MVRGHLTRRGLGLAAGAAILVLSLGFRTVDAPLCAGFPWGTHFVWHGLNAVMLAWMIEVWLRHRRRVDLDVMRASAYQGAAK